MGFINLILHSFAHNFWVHFHYTRYWVICQYFSGNFIFLQKFENIIVLSSDFVGRAV